MHRLIPAILCALIFAHATYACDGKIKRLFKKKSGPETFLSSDDYRDGEEVVGKFLQEEDYALMVEDLEYRDIEFDWGWVRGNYRKPSKVDSIDFELGQFSTITVDRVQNFSSSLEPGLEEHIQEVFSAAMRRLDLEVVDDEGQLTLSLAIVDYKSDSTYIYFGNLDPFIELELKLTHGSPLLLLRVQEHGTTPRAAASDIASEVLRFLR